MSMLNKLCLNKEEFLNKLEYQWQQSSEQFPDFLCEIPRETKTENEQYIKSASDNISRQIKHYTRFPIFHPLKQKKLKHSIDKILHKETIIGIHNAANQETLDAFKGELLEFLRQERMFSPELPITEIGQAIRNYLVFIMFKEIHQVKTGFNWACFGYSMLYPFTDNYIDSKNISVQKKQEYNQMIRDKIAGNTVYPKSEHQKKTCALLERIENDYPRSVDSSIYNLLQMMLDAQEKSLHQQNGTRKLTAEERLKISIYKGSISVLIDRFFVNKEITEEDLLFYLGLGFFLQLADDLQDIEEDSVKGNQTIFTIDLQEAEEEKLVNKLLHFIHRIMEAYEAENNSFKEFVLSNCYQLIFLSLAGSKKFFSKKYLSKMEKFTPVTYSFFDNLNENLFTKNDFKMNDKYIKILNDILFN